MKNVSQYHCDSKTSNWQRELHLQHLGFRLIVLAFRRNSCGFASLGTSPAMKAAQIRNDTNVRWELFQRSVWMKIKAVLAGDSGVGKSCIYDRLSHAEYRSDNIPTVGGSYRALNVRSRDGDHFDIALWDTAGQERYQTLVPIYFEHCQFLLLVYSVTDPTSFERIPTWLEIAKDRADSSMKVILLGNKCDLDQQRAVDVEALANLGTEIQAYLAFEVSAKTGIGIDEVLQGLADGCVAIETARAEELRVSAAGDNPGCC
jgi:small GTP-binding protein